MVHEAQPLVGEQVTVALRRNGILVQLHGRLQLAGSVGVLLANGDGLGLFPWHTVESIVVAQPTTAGDRDQV